jgi:hypothetical protein
MEPTGQSYTDQAGLFIAPSSTGNNYLLILYDYGSNAILAKPIKSQWANDILNAYKVVHTKLVAAGLCPELQRLNNECSEIFKAYILSQDVTFQLVWACKLLRFC